MLDPEPLAGTTAIVTGGGAGIGGGTSRLLAKAGAAVVVNDIVADLAHGAVADIEASGGRGVAVVGDVRQSETVHRVIAAAQQVGNGRIDILVNNVGDYRPPLTRGFLASTEADWQGQYAINLEHVFRFCHAAIPTMIEHGGGAIVNVSTVEAKRAVPGRAVYSAFNAGVIAFSRSLAVEFAGNGIRVNVIAPDMADTLQTPAQSMLRGRNPELVKCWIPIGRFGLPDDYAQVVLFLASDQSRFVTGQIIDVDGGTLAASGWYRTLDGSTHTNLPDLA